jgi:hypothetical protein
MPMSGRVEKRRKCITQVFGSRYLYGAPERGQLSILWWIERSALDGKNRGTAATGNIARRSARST